jgi:hypothetical protein
MPWSVCHPPLLSNLQRHGVLISGPLVFNGKVTRPHVSSIGRVSVMWNLTNSVRRERSGAKTHQYRVKLHLEISGRDLNARFNVLNLYVWLQWAAPHVGTEQRLGKVVRWQSPPIGELERCTSCTPYTGQYIVSMKGLQKPYSHSLLLHGNRAEVVMIAEIDGTLRHLTSGKSLRTIPN